MQDDPAPTVLLIERELHARTALHALLEHTGFRTLALPTAVMPPDGFSPDLLLIDHWPPEQCVADLSQSPHCHLIIMTRTRPPIRLGDAHWVSKPVHFGKLESLLRELTQTVAPHPKLPRTSADFL